MITVILHEAGHSIMALLCGVKVEEFGIGFGRPYIAKKLFGIEFRLSPWLLGGYTKFKGEKTKEPDGFLAQRYSKKVAILLSGVFINFVLAFVCYLINYGSIKIGLWFDIHLLYSIFAKHFTLFYRISEVLPDIKINYLSYLGIINLTCGIINLIPFPSLDGACIWIYSLERFFKFENFVKFFTYMLKIGFSILMVLQAWLIYYWLLI